MLPKVSFCNKRFASLMTEIAFAKFAKEIVNNPNNSNSVFLDLEEPLAGAARDYSNLLLSLDRLRNALLTETNGNNTYMNDTEQTILKQWSEVQNELSSRRLLSTLLTDLGEDVFTQARRSVNLQPDVSDSMV